MAGLGYFMFDLEMTLKITSMFFQLGLSNFWSFQILFYLYGVIGRKNLYMLIFSVPDVPSPDDGAWSIIGTPKPRGQNFFLG